MQGENPHKFKVFTTLITPLCNSGFKYYDDFDIFKQRIDYIVSSTDKDNKTRIDFLVTDKVQLFDEFVPCCKSFKMLPVDVDFCAKSVA